uniref:Uncharacterized protein n=1 Tax=Ditylenchus dipsaci TaxID=166011 RepID=A0A915DTD3_9BILA
MIIMAANPVIHTYMDNADGASLSRNSLDEFKRLEKEVQQEELSSEEVDYNSSSSVVSGPPNTGVNMNNGPKHTFSTANTSVHNSPQQSLLTKKLARNLQLDHLGEDVEVAKQTEEAVGSMQDLKLVDGSANEPEKSATDDANLGNPRIVEDSVSTTHLNTTLIPTTEVSQHFESTTPELSILDQTYSSLKKRKQNRSVARTANLQLPTVNQSKTKSASLTPESNKNCKCESIKKDPKLKTKVCSILPVEVQQMASGSPPNIQWTPSIVSGNLVEYHCQLSGLPLAIRVFCGYPLAIRGTPTGKWIYF